MHGARWDDSALRQLYANTDTTLSRWTCTPRPRLVLTQTATWGVRTLVLCDGWSTGQFQDNLVFRGVVSVYTLKKRLPITVVGICILVNRPE